MSDLSGHKRTEPDDARSNPGCKRHKQNSKQTGDSDDNGATTRSCPCESLVDSIHHHWSEPAQERCLDVLLKTKLHELNERDDTGFTPVQSAIECIDPVSLKRLLECKADINQKANGKAGPLEHAFDCSAPQCARLLIESKCDVNELRSFDGKTHLWTECKGLRVESVKVILKANVDIKPSDLAEMKSILEPEPFTGEDFKREFHESKENEKSDIRRLLHTKLVSAILPPVLANVIASYI
jgi:hypothetical protein